VRRAVSIFFVLMLAACSRSTAADAKTQAAPAPAPAAPAAAAQSTPPPAAAELPPPVVKPVPAQLPEVVARVNGEAINAAELQNAVKGLEGRAGGPVPADQRDRVFRGVLDDMIGYKLLVQEAKARKVAVPDADVEAQVAQIRSQFPDQQQFEQALAAQKMTLQEVRDDARTEISVEKLVEGEISAKIAVKPEAISDFYQKNQDKFQQGTARARESYPDSGTAGR
jgi:parvulin-like peptidyl-prolyl isomerase